jgi:hypothetical protein
MHRELDGLKRECQAIERHDDQTREVLSELREKHLLHGRP